MLKFLREYYMIGTTPVVLIMTEGRYPLQAWQPDMGLKALRREDIHILTIANSSHAQPITAAQFETYCADRAIDDTIPLKQIKTSFTLASRIPAKLYPTIPAPRPAADDARVSGLLTRGGYGSSTRVAFS